MKFKRGIKMNLSLVASVSLCQQCGALMGLRLPGRSTRRTAAGTRRPSSSRPTAAPLAGGRGVIFTTPLFVVYG